MASLQGEEGPPSLEYIQAKDLFPPKELVKEEENLQVRRTGGSWWEGLPAQFVFQTFKSLEDLPEPWLSPPGPLKGVGSSICQSVHYWSLWP